MFGYGSTIFRIASPARLRWLFAIALPLIGLLSVDDWSSTKWVIATVAIFSAPLLVQFQSNRTLRVYAVWFGAFLLLQMVTTPWIIDPDYFTLPGDLRDVHDYVPGEMPGVTGRQRVTTDEKGFRTTREIDYKHKPQSHLRIIAIGGSTTEQITLDDRRTWAHLLQEQLQGSLLSMQVEVINTGVSGLRARHHYATLKKISAYEPDVVLILLGINDWNRHVIETLSPELLGGPGRLRESQSFLTLNFRNSLAGRAIDRIHDRFMAWHAVSPEHHHGIDASHNGSMYSYQRPVHKHFLPEDVQREYAEQLEQIGKQCQASGLICVFVTQPTAYRSHVPAWLQQRFWMTPPYAGYTLDMASLAHLASLYNTYLLQFASRSGFSSCDLAAEIGSVPEDFSDDCHFSVQGAQHVAQVLGACVQQVVQDKKNRIQHARVP